MENQARSFGTILDYCKKNNCLLIHYNQTYWMFSKETGSHSLKQDVEYNHGFMEYDTVPSRVKLHWEGFKSNQTN
jgi:hypothetical protein